MREVPFPQGIVNDKIAPPGVEHAHRVEQVGRPAEEGHDVEGDFIGQRLECASLRGPRLLFGFFVGCDHGTYVNKQAPEGGGAKKY